MCDQLVYQLSTRNDLMESVMTKKELVYIQDQNGSAYNGTITFETSSISNSGKFQDLTNAFIVIPYVVQFTSPGAADLNGEINRFCLGMKSGWWNLIHAMSVDLNGINIIQLTSFLNLYASYKCMTSWSYNDLWKNGEAVGFWKDSVDSFRYLAAVGVGGIGATNNTIQQIGAAAGGLQQLSVTGTGNWSAQTIAYGYNEGLLRRCLANSYVFNENGVAAATDATAFITVSQASQVGLCYHGRTSATGTYYWRYNAVIRLRDISDFFDNKVPLHRGGVYRFTINYNACNMTVTCSAAGGTLTPSAVVQTAGQTTPWMFSSNALNNPNALLGTAAARALPIVSGINISGAVGTPSISSCRLYIPLYTLNEAYEEQLLSLNPEKTIQYKDIYQYTLTNTAAGGSFNSLVTNGLAKPLSVIIIPFDSTGYSGVTSLTSPFSSTPATTDPYMLVRNFNVQVSGINIFQQNVDFSWVEFQSELSKINAVNGNCTSGLTSGLISQHDYERGYCYVVADLSRQYSADDFVPKSILVSGTNASDKPVTYYVFVEYMRTVTINLASGNVRI